MYQWMGYNIIFFVSHEYTRVITLEFEGKIRNQIFLDQSNHDH